MASALLTLLEARIATCHTEIDRVKAEADQSVAALKGEKDVLQKAKLLLVANPDAEKVLAQLKTLGVW